ncbi:unnamed protein product [Caenorhabditis bovis]|uniref:Rad50/SbcC-type AAA domain-containing protein n=1 Tax=Caenorhabditis bovis TaxID=2654633 RepID=A0A8S1ETI0_9PELO|nr:unnamed protein product [Caenorhabditis bovis]
MTRLSASPDENMNPADAVCAASTRKRINLQMPETPSRNSEVFDDDDNCVDISKRLKPSNPRDELAIAGRVAGVRLQNFMCHSNLQIEFDTRHNNCFYIGGPNGSGKSALFAAINIGLGGKGSDNDRGNTVKSYVKDGTSSAKISITLTNEGQNSNPEYGEFVEIERNITQTSSTYTLKSIKGFGRNRKEIVSKKKGDIDKIVRRFNIHLSNPAFWMSQDRSRSFLSDFKPATIYKFYQTATELDRIKMAYAKFADDLNDVNSILFRKKLELNKRTKELQRLHEVLSMHNKIEDDRKKILRYQWCLMFCAIRDIEDELEIVRQKQKHIEEKAARNKEESLNNRQERATLMRDVDVLHDRIAEKKQEHDIFKEEINSEKAKFRDESDQIDGIHHEIRNRKQEIKLLNTKIMDAKKKIRAISENAAGTQMKQKYEEFERKYEELKATRETMEKSGKIVGLQNERDEAERVLSELENRRADITQEMNEMKRLADECQEKLRRANAAKINKVNKYGPKMSEIVAEIHKNRHKFSKLPKGPIGQYISVENKKWALAVEECIGKLATTFICDNQMDAKVLQSIFDKLRLTKRDAPPMHVSRFLGKRHQNLREPSSEWKTIYRVLKFSDDDVHNVIIDKSQPECVGLVESQEEAMEEMDSANPPRNVIKVFTANGDQAFARGPNSQYRFYAARRGISSQGLFEPGDGLVDHERLNRTIDDCRNRLHELNNDEYKEIESKIRKMRRQRDEASKAVDAFEAKHADVRQREIRMQREVHDLEAKMASESDLEDIESLNRCIEDMEGRIPKIEEQIDEWKQKEAAIRTRMETFSAKIAQLEKDLNVYKEEIEAERQSVDATNEKVMLLDAAFSKFTTKKARFDADREQLYNEDTRLQACRDDKIAMVNESKKLLVKPDGVDDPPDLSDFPPTEHAEKTYEELKKRIEMQTEEIDPSVTLEMVQEFKESLKNDKRMCRRILEVLNKLHEILEHRVALYPLLKKCTEMKVRNRFKELLQIRGNFVGDLEIDNERQTLNVIVRSVRDVERDGTTTIDGADDDDDDEEPAKKKSKAVKRTKKDIRDLKGLSGGERSFVTAALVMSLWEVMEQPFRMMDEFDVFMDMVNRKLVMDLLVEMATDHFPYNQFIFFTPQGIKELKKSFDKGLRSIWISEQLATISRLGRVFEENPVPTFVNSTLVRLAEAFKDGSNDLRVGIARALGQCGSHLSLAFSSAEILRRILTVSHSNDPDAREAVLDMLASLAVICPDNTQVHHIICESLSTDHRGEFRAACAAMKAFAALSSEFSETVVSQVGKLLDEPTTTDAQKIQLCDVFATMRADAHTLEHVFGICATVLTRNCTDEFLAAFLRSMTSLCIEVRYTVPKQIDILLGTLTALKTKKNNNGAAATSSSSSSGGSDERICIILKELRRLAKYSNIWSEEQIRRFAEFLNAEMSAAATSRYFEVGVELSRSCSSANIKLLKDLAISSTAYGSVKNPAISVRYIQMAANIFCNRIIFDGESPETISTAMTSLSVIIVADCTSGKMEANLAKRLYRAIGDVLCVYPYTQFEFSMIIISSVLSAFDDLACLEDNLEQRLEMLCRLIDTDRAYIPDIQKWAINVYQRKKPIFEAFPTLFAYLAIAIGTELPPEFPSVMFDASTSRYETARSAFRNGRWIDVALPNLEAIETKNLAKLESDWILALRELAAAQLVEFTPLAIDNQQSRLRSALSILSVAFVYSNRAAHLRVPLEFIERFLHTSEAFSRLLSTCEPFLTILTSALKPGHYYNAIVARRFTVALSTVEKIIIDLQSSWFSLCRSSFCADPTSLDLITLYYSKSTVLLAAVQMMLGKMPPETNIQLPPLSNPRTCAQMQREKLQWIIEKLARLKFKELPTLNTIQVFHTIIEQLAMTPYMMPRFFFQQFYNVEFKISTTPQMEGNRAVSVQNGETVPIRVDGAILSNHPYHIRSVIIIAEISSPTNHAANRYLTETVEPNEKNYFSAQFLLQFKWSCDIKLRIEFIDATTRKQWRSSTTTTLPIMVREVTKAR